MKPESSGSLCRSFAAHRTSAAITGPMAMRNTVSSVGIALGFVGGASAFVVVEEVINPLRQFFVDAFDAFQLRQRRA